MQSQTITHSTINYMTVVIHSTALYILSMAASEYALVMLYTNYVTPTHCYCTEVSNPLSPHNTRVTFEHCDNTLLFWLIISCAIIITERCTAKMTMPELFGMMAILVSLTFGFPYIVNFL